MLSLEDAKDRIGRLGEPYGDVFPQVGEGDRPALAEWFVAASGVPNLTARRARSPVASGNLCRLCGGFLVRTGTCETCQSCGNSTGGCG